MMVAGVACVAYAGIGGWWLHHSGGFERATNVVSGALWNVTADAGFSLSQVYLTGRSHADSTVVKAALDVHPGQPILSLDLTAMQARLSAIPEVKTAMLSRQLPGELHVALTERVPVALWQQGGSHVLVDADGVILSRDKYKDASPLPVIVGEDAPKHVQEFAALLDRVPSLRQEVVAAVRVGERRWNVQLKRDITVMLPERNPEAAWQRFAGLVQREALLGKAIRSVDMRMEDRVFIMPSEQQQNPITLTTAKET
jgi:cell division protein FtsQ